MHRNMYVGGPRQPAFKGRDKPGAGVRPPVFEGKLAVFSHSTRAVSHRRQVCLATLERRLPGAAHTYVAWRYEAFSRGFDPWRHCGQPPDVKHDIAQKLWKHLGTNDRHLRTKFSKMRSIVNPYMGVGGPQ